MNNPLYFELQADDLERAIAFYKTVFGWSFEVQAGTPVDYFRIETEGIDGGLLKRPAPVQGSGTNAAVVSMEVEHYDETARTIVSSGGREVMPKFAVPGRCWQGYFADTEGNTFGIFEVDTDAQ